MAVSFSQASIETFVGSLSQWFYTCLGCGSVATALLENVNDSAVYTPLSTAYLKRYSNLCIGSPIGLTVAWDGFGTIGNRWFVIADGVTLLDTGCTAGTGSAPVTIPAGTKVVEYIVQATCSGSGTDIWSLIVT